MRKIAKICHNILTKTNSPFSEVHKFHKNFLNSSNIEFIQSMYQRWIQDKSSVSPSFNAFFTMIESGHDPEDAFMLPPAEGHKRQINMKQAQVGQQLKYRLLIDRIRTLGHQFAKLDPLELQQKNMVGKLDQKLLSHKQAGLTEEQSQNYIYKKNLRLQPIQGKQDFKINEVQQYLRDVYCGPIGYQFMHLTDKVQRVFLRTAIQEKLQTLATNEPSKQERLKTFDRLCKDQTFIDFLGSKFGNYKRFGIQGLNSGISAIGSLFQDAVSAYGAEHLVLGMAHRGRLNTLHCIFDKPAQSIIEEFLQTPANSQLGDSAGDVKYHLGYLTKKKYGDKEAVLSILPNPSHLEAVNPLVYGRTRALQQKIQDQNREKVVGVIVHGDAAISGQGIVYETAQMQALKDYCNGGIIHIVFNNQIGFTTNPNQSRSSYYCSEIAKVTNSPVFHINGDEPDYIDKCMQIAMSYRNKFKKDFYIDIIGYRRYGHNEQDQPTFTQPKMYEKVKQKPSIFEIYSKKLIDKKVITKQQIQQKIDFYQNQYQEAYTKVLNNKAQKNNNQIKTSELKEPTLWGKKTGIAKNDLTTIFNKITSWPEDFSIHPTIKKIYQERIKNFNNNQPLDWATMESLAFGSLLYEGYGVRLSGQDVERGTFSHRHALISDQKKDVEKHMFLKSISPKVTVTNSHLSQYGVMGFQYGYSITDPNNLIIWQAQFGDFANGAQIIIDNFIVSAQTKWKQQSGIVLNLPHGMDGQGPQHSSARMERFLILSDDNCDVIQNLSYEQQLQTCNIQVVCCSTTSNYFHALRRQLRRNYRKPLIMFNSKKLLKYKPANRPIEEILEGTQFKPVYEQQSKIDPQKVKKVIFCDGQFYYELKNAREQFKRQDIAIIRIQQIAPFPHEQIKQILNSYKNVQQYIWAQQEHENFGAWNYMRPRLQLLVGKKIIYEGRSSAGSPAVGFLKYHKKQQKKLLEKIFNNIK